MKKLQKFMVAVLAIYTAATALSQPTQGAPAARVASDSIRVTFRDGYGEWQTLGQVSGGNVTITPTSASSPFYAVTGTVTRPGQAGGSASVTFDIHAFFGISLGKVVVSDPSVALYAVVPVFFRPIGRNGIQTYGSASWFNPLVRPAGDPLFYQFDWVVNDEA